MLKIFLDYVSGSYKKDFGFELKIIAIQAWVEEGNFLFKSQKFRQNQNLSGSDRKYFGNLHMFGKRQEIIGVK